MQDLLIKSNGTFYLPRLLPIYPGDIFLTHGESLLSRLIRIGETSPSESPTIVNHTGIVVEEGTISTALAIEALSTVKLHTIYSQYHTTPDIIYIFRPTHLSEKEKFVVVQKARGYEGRKYGWGKIAAHLGDWLLGGRYVWRRLARMDKYPICSWVVASSYGEVGENFGVKVGEASPDDIWDWCLKRGEWKMIARIEGL